MSYYFKKIGTSKAVIAALASEVYFPSKIRDSITETLQAGAELAGPSIVYLVEAHGHLDAAYPSNIGKLEVTILDRNWLLDVNLTIAPAAAPEQPKS